MFCGSTSADAVHRLGEAHLLPGSAKGHGLHVRRQLGRRVQQTAAAGLHSQRECLEKQRLRTN